MTRRPIAEVRVIRMPHLAAGCIRVEIECSRSCTGLTSFPGPALSLTRPMMVTMATFEHEARCGQCSTDEAHRQGDQQVREMTDRAWDELLTAAQQRYDAVHRN